MTYDEFMTQYDPDRRCIAEYRPDPDDFTFRGLVLDKPYRSLGGKWCVWIDSFYKAIPLDQVRDVRATSVRWLGGTR
jgi:hypothetical protein